MADNTEEEHLDNPTNTQAEIPADDIIPVTDAKTIYQNPEIENMEVHAHDLHKSPGQGWKHYIFEFLMLFLAVFCGFLAENFREHQVEKGREINYIESMLQDLRRDTANFRFLETRGRETLLSIDTIISLLKSAGKKSNTSLLYYYARKITITGFPFEIFDRTYSQMKSSGNLRLLHTQAVADSITSYYYDIVFLASQQDFINKLQMDYIENASVVFDASVFQTMYKDAGMTPDFTLQTRAFVIPDAPKNNPPLADDSKHAIDALIGSAHYLYGRVIRVNGIIISENEKAVRLIKFLENEYQLK